MDINSFPSTCSISAWVLMLGNIFLPTEFISHLSPLITNDNYSHYRNSAACYQLAQSVLKIGSALAERVE